MIMNTMQSLSVNVEKNATGIHFFNGDEVMEITTSSKHLMAQIRKLSKVNNEVVIDCEPSADNGGFMLALVPVECLRLGVKRKVEMKEERKKELSERMKALKKRSI